MAFSPWLFVAAFQLLFFSVLVLLVQYTFVGRQQWLKFKRMSRAGPIYRFLCVYLPGKGFALVECVLWAVYGPRMDQAPTAKTKPRLRLTSRSTTSVQVAWSAKPSSRFSRDSFELQYRGCVGPVDLAMSTEWITEPHTTATDFTATGIPAGQCLEFRCRTINTKGAGPWTESLRVYTRQKPLDGGGRGPLYSWRQSSATVQVVVPLAVDVPAKELRFTCTGERLGLVHAIARQGVTEERVLLEGELFAPVLPDSAEWTIDEVPVWKGPAAKQREPGRAAVITLEKKKPTFKSKDHWPQLVKNHPTIDISSLPGALDLAEVY